MDINQRLLTCLFDHPTPIVTKTTLFNVFKSRIFPDQKLFRKFLIVKDPNQKLEISKNLLQRLCFESNYAPSYRLFQNLYDFENCDENRSSNERYCARDHFIHCIYLYMEGIYIYFYHPIFCRDLTEHFVVTREEKGSNPIINATKDFISSWKYFCLYHDLAYPIEQINEKTEISQFGQRALDTIAGLYQNVVEEWTLRILARGVVIYEMIKDRRNDRLENRFRCNQYCYKARSTGLLEQVDEQKVKEEFVNYIGIDKIYSNRYIKMLSGGINKKSWITVLCNTELEIPIAFRKYEKDHFEVYIIQNREVLLSEDKIIEYLENEDTTQNPLYRTRYYIKEELLTKYLEMNGVGSLEESRISSILNLITMREEVCKADRNAFYRICCEEDLDNYVYQHYQALIKIKKKLLPEHMDTLNRLNIMAATYNYQNIRYEKYINKTLKSDLNKMIIDRMKKNERIRTSWDDAKKKLSSEIEDKTKDISKEVAEVTKALINAIATEITKEKEMDKMAESVWYNLQNSIQVDTGKNHNFLSAIFSVYRRLVGGRRQSSNEVLQKMNDKIRLKAQPPYISLDDFVAEFERNSTIKQVMEQVNEQLNNMAQSPDKTVTIDDIRKGYKLKHSNYDHGICAAWIFLYHITIAIELIQANPKNKDLSVFTLCWPVESDQFLEKLIDNYKKVFSYTCEGIFSHNIYKKTFEECFKGETWKISPTENPFSYFCALMDSLQTWDRRIYSISGIDREILFNRDYYDIRVSGDQIVLQIHTLTESINDVKYEIRDGLDEYLEDCSSFISIEFV